ncbi:hypothetical protein [Roseiconus lacunae]|uniref:Flagellar M-ring N-terminal domain-containing protein n=1 Tax=Roseiconus lacunae TaxID=2605694 RepID=A0ABT7PR97_9BACT|nr:hypothetical protein [Roseiconus lacunae]MDM4019007.1 hypothetical protein [Roseiconus lacunae]WRQ51811.1 hypothetical protein U8335_04550 [Stieleria sp. HD01]
MSKIAIWGACVTLILIGMLLVPTRQSSNDLQPLLGDRRFSHSQIDELDLEFSAAGLDGYEHRDGRFWVRPEQRHQFLSIAQQSRALPVDLADSPEESFTGFEIFASESQRQSKLQSLKARELGTKLCAFPDIAWASVDYDQQRLGGIDQETIQSASVVIIPSNEKPLSPNRIDMIRQYVAGAYAGMSVEQVTVTDTTAMESYNGKIDEQKRAQRHVEYELEHQLAEMLSGFGDVRIAVMHLPNKSSEGAPQPHVSIAIPESQFHLQWARDYRSQHHHAALVPWPTDHQLVQARQRVLVNVKDNLPPLLASPTTHASIHLCSFPDAIPEGQYATGTTKVISLADIREFAANNIPLTVSVLSLLAVTLICSTAALRLRMRETDPTSPAFANPSHYHRDSPKVANGKTPQQSDETSIRDDLTELIEANPELAAQIVHRWVAEAA